MGRRPWFRGAAAYRKPSRTGSLEWWLSRVVLLPQQLELNLFYGMTRDGLPWNVPPERGPSGIRRGLRKFSSTAPCLKGWRPQRTDDRRSPDSEASRRPLFVGRSVWPNARCELSAPRISRKSGLVPTRSPPGWIQNSKCENSLDVITGDSADQPLPTRRATKAGNPQAQRTRTSGIGTMNLPPRVRYSACWPSTSSARFQTSRST